MEVLSKKSFWQKRLQGGTMSDVSVQPPRSWKKRYLKARSLQFVDPLSANFYIHGMLLGSNRSRLAFATLESPPSPGTWRGGRFQFCEMQSSSLSFDVWFCVFSGTARQPAGGVIFGLQQMEAVDRWPGDNPQHFVLVDTKRDLYCSVLNVKKVVAKDLRSNCWYHLALTYDIDLHRQDVFVNGEHVWSEVGELRCKWPYVRHEQIGNGFCGNYNPSAGGAQFPHARTRGAWYPLYGLIDEFRVWKLALPAEAVAELALGKHPDGFEEVGTIKRAHDGRGSWRNTTNVRCTRPAEGKNVIIH